MVDGGLSGAYLTPETGRIGDDALMVEKLRPRSAYDYVALLALLVALSTGGAYAANTVFSADIVDGQVKTVDLAPRGATEKLANGAVTSEKVKDDNLIQAGDVAPTTRSRAPTSTSRRSRTSAAAGRRAAT